MTGEGKATYANGSVYEGAFVKGTHNGKGKLTNPSGYTYEGDWLLGVKEGTGDCKSCLRKHRCRARHLAPGRLKVDHAADILARLLALHHGGGGRWLGGQCRLDPAGQ